MEVPGFTSANPYIIMTSSDLQTGARAPKTSTSKNFTRRMTALEQTLNTSGTNFDNGDQLNLRIVRISGRSDPVSLDGTEATNCFPLTICVIG